MFLPRSKKVWAYGSNMGFSGNAKYLFLYTSSLNEITSVWIGNKSEVAAIRQLGLKAYYRYGVKGVLYSLYSGVYIYNSYISDVNLYTFGGAKRVNLWHGVGIKNCERKITTGPLYEIFKTNNPFVKLKYLSLFVKPHIFLSTSKQMKDLCKECFDIRYDQFVDNMYPRCDILFMKEEDRMAFISKYENRQTLDMIERVRQSSYTYLYMPTWRDSGYNFLQDFDFNTLNNLLRDRNELLLFKPHPVTKVSFDTTLSNIISVDKYVDLNSLMSYSDCLITDYSSVYYDYILMPQKRLILYIPDYEHYISQDRDLAFDYMDSTEGEFAYSFDDLLKLVINRNADYFAYDRIPELINSFWGNAIGTTTIDLYQKLKSMI